ncbi:MAG: glycosyltransferase N-terminal domain-containing protein [Spirochaetota bacterium]
MTIRLIFYNILLHLFSPLIILGFLINALFNPRVRRGHAYRLGLTLPPKPRREAVWIHAVSVGEVNAVKGFIERIRAAGKYEVYLSMSTMTGYDAAVKGYKDTVTLFYFPFDWPLVIHRFFDSIKPAVMMIAEIEIWPNFIAIAKRRNIPLYLINARMSEPIAKKYRPYTWFFSSFYAAYDGMFAQSDTDRAFMESIGMQGENIAVPGNLKYDVRYTLDAAKSAAVRQRLPNGKIILVAGSTHEPEESYLITALAKCGRKNDVFPVIVPRDIKRGEELKKLAADHGYTARCVTDGEGSTDMLIVNVIGELLYYYAHADIVLMGGSFSPSVGGHNILEPLFFKKPVIVGPNMHNFFEMDEYFAKNGGTMKVSSFEAIGDALAVLINDEQKRIAVGARGESLLASNGGAAERTYKAIFG